MAFSRSDGYCTSLADPSEIWRFSGQHRLVFRWHIAAASTMKSTGSLIPFYLNAWNHTEQALSF